MKVKNLNRQHGFETQGGDLFLIKMKSDFQPVYDKLGEYFDKEFNAFWTREFLPSSKIDKRIVREKWEKKLNEVKKDVHFFFLIYGFHPIKEEFNMHINASLKDFRKIDEQKAVELTIKYFLRDKARLRAWVRRAFKIPRFMLSAKDISREWTPNTKYSKAIHDKYEELLKRGMTQEKTYNELLLPAFRAELLDVEFENYIKSYRSFVKKGK